VVEDPLESIESFRQALGDWRPALNSHLESASYRQLYDYVVKEYKAGICYPPKNLIFNAFSKAQFKDLKVVIVG